MAIHNSVKSAAIIGGGIAGCTTAHLLAKQGIKVTLYEKQSSIANGASGNPIGMLYPRLNGDALNSQFALNAYIDSSAFYRSLGLSDTVFKQCGMLQLGFNTRELARITKIASWIKPSIAHMLTAQEASQIAGITVSHPALYFPASAWLNPQAICNILMTKSEAVCETSSEITNILQTENQFSLQINQQRTALFDYVVIANAHDAMKFQQTTHVTCTSVRGQLTQLSSTSMSRALNTIICSDGYFSPAIDHMHTLGATFDIDDSSHAVTQADHNMNIAKLENISKQLADNLRHNVTGGRTAFRCTASDHLPMVGEVLNATAMTENPPRPNAAPQTLPWLKGLYVNIAHGSHGFMTAPFTAQCINDLILQKTNNASYATLHHLNPNRYLLRQLGLKKLAKTVASSSDHRHK